MLPWWAFFPVAGGVVWLGEKAYSVALEAEAEKQAALDAGIPAAVDLGAFDRETDRHRAGEVHVRGWIDTDLNYELVQRTNGVPTSRRYMYMLFGEADPAGSPVVRAAMVLTGDEQETFVDGLDRWMVDFGAQGFIFQINGFGETSVTLGGLARDAIEDEGLRTSEDFIFVEPFFEGREAALAPHGVPQKSRMIFWAVAAGVALIGVVKRRFGKSAGRKPRNLTETKAAPAMPPLPPATPLASGISPDTPLGRIAARNAARALAEQEPVATANAGPTTHPPRPVAPVAPARARGKGVSNVVFLSRLALAMIFVGTLSYDPTMALPLLAVLLPFFVLLRLVAGMRRMIGARRAAQVI
ncbi:hypothetical protein [Sinisalibacter aestuarii]|nr:hypothetical protein [Sinisalibacter aestuarii]